MAIQLAAAAATTAVMMEGTVAQAMISMQSTISSTLQAAFRSQADSVNAVANGAVSMSKDAAKVGNS